MTSSVKKPGVEAWLYGLFAGASVLVAALGFVHSLKWQMFLSQARSGALAPGEWSAPLDDVFIHFDFARSAARGAFFEWSEGNGYSSGGTSLLYPLVLAVGYRLGFVGSSLMLWAQLVAATGVFAVLLAGRRAFGGLPRACAWFLPPLMLSIGALNWSLFSGMEVAFFLGIWGLCLIAWDDTFHLTSVYGEATPARRRSAALILGLSCALLVGTRPEAVPTVAAFAISTSIHYGKRHGWGAAVASLMLSAVPGALVIVAQAVANRIFTGDFSAAGALTKLELHDPLLNAHDVWEKWKFHVGYQIGRITEHHMGRVEWSGALLWALALVPLTDRRTRHYSALIWVQALLWIATVGLNGQVIWQNERYTMPAVAWLLVSSALGAGVVSSWAWRRDLSTFVKQVWARRLAQVASLTGLLALLGVYAFYQVPRYRDQLWFFGRASRNIADQHVRAARVIKALTPRPRRILVGDAGAIPYETDIPSFDIIGLGGYHDLPVARAQRWGIAATLELIQRLPPTERPDLLAIYPSWWGSFPLWFGKPVLGVPVRGNVICGGHTKMLYQPDWQPFDDGLPLGQNAEQTKLIDALDVADLVDERKHQYTLQGDVGFIEMKLLTTGTESESPIWDAGRLLKPGATLSFELQGFQPGRPARLVLRSAAPRPSLWVIEVNGQEAGKVALTASDYWQHSTLDVPAELVQGRLSVRVISESGENFLYHVWGVEPP